MSECSGTCPTVIDTIVLDDLVNAMPFRQAVMKIDIQGYERVAFQRASRLLSAVHFTHIFMEWEIMREFFTPPPSNPPPGTVDRQWSPGDRHLVERTIRLLFRHGYRPYSLVYEGGRALDPEEWGSWPLDVVWHRIPISAEQSRINRNHFQNWPR